MTAIKPTDDPIQSDEQTLLARPKSGLMLKPKGSCWYCNQPLDEIRRFCSKVCAADYQAEEEALHRLQP